MTLKNLSKIIDTYQEQLGITDISQFSSLKGLPFYNWTTAAERSQNSLQSFNDVIGLPLKNGVAYPLFDYERLLFDSLQN